jgi:hypothetical protein
MQPAPQEPIINIGATTPARIVTASRQAVIEKEGLRITLPTSLDLWAGWRGEIPLKIENSSAASRELVFYARPPVNVFVNDKTVQSSQIDGAIEVARISIAAGQTSETALQLQSLRAGQLELPLVCLGQEARLQINVQVVERGAYFMYRCWYEGAEFFQSLWSDGREKIDARERRAKMMDSGREMVRSGMRRDQAERETKKALLEQYQPAPYEHVSNWQEVYNRKKNQHAETFGFQYVDVDGLGWVQVERQKGRYDWAVGDFMLKLWQDHFGAEPFVRIELPPEWVQFERNPSGSYGFFDPQNAGLMNSWENYCKALAERYDGDGQNDAPGSPQIRDFILSNEPEAYWLNVDFDREGWPVEKGVVFETDWWREGQGGADPNKVYARKFGDLLYETTMRAARAIHQASPDARVATPQFTPLPNTSRELYDYMLSKGLAQHIDAWGTHPVNTLNQFWQMNPQAIWWVEDANNQAPPFSSEDLSRVRGALDRKGQTLQTNRPLEEVKRENPYMGKLWRKHLDESFSNSLEDIHEVLAKHNADLPIWVTEELTIGPLATNRRENLIAALRGYAIVFHQKVETTVLAGFIGAETRSGNVSVGYLPDPTARELIIDVGRAIGGASPVAKFDSQWFKPGVNDYLDYRWAVYKLFNRGDEDIIAIWSNSAKDEVLDFELQPGVELRNIQQVKYDGGESQFKETGELSSFPTHLTLRPLKQFYFISVTSDSPKFGWLKSVKRRLASGEQALIQKYQNTVGAVEDAKRNLRGRRVEDAGRYRSIPRMLIEAEDALIMGNFGQSGQKLDEINNLLSQL